MHGYIRLFGLSFYTFIVALFLFGYVCFSTVYRNREIFENQNMTLGWALIFAALKISVTFLLAYRLSKETMTDEERRHPLSNFYF